MARKRIIKADPEKCHIIHPDPWWSECTEHGESYIREVCANPELLGVLTNLVAQHYPGKTSDALYRLLMELKSNG